MDDIQYSRPMTIKEASELALSFKGVFKQVSDEKERYSTDLKARIAYTTLSSPSSGSWMRKAAPKMIDNHMRTYLNEIGVKNEEHRAALGYPRND